jgi:hypothetical protein
VGNGTLHISHAIWGALMMAIAIVLAVSYLTPSMRTAVAFLGGVGFGFFVDELGKFITRDVDYFFKPTFSLIYLVFLAMFFSFRSIERKDFGPSEGVLNGLEALKAAAIGRLDEVGRRKALELLATTGSDGPVAAGVAALLADAGALPPHRPSRWARTATAARARYLRWTAGRAFPATVSALFLLRTAGSLVVSAAIVFDGSGIRGFGEWTTAVSVLVATALTVVGVALLPFARLRAYRWFDASLLVSILVTQIFVFDQQQLAGTLTLAASLLYWVLLRSAVRAEQTPVALGS